jgi:hypothetical protein
MPVDKAKVHSMIDMMDAWLRQREQDQLEGIDDDDEPPCNPLDAPPSEPFYSDGPPEKIHGEGKEDTALWPPRPRVPVRIETL